MPTLKNHFYYDEEKCEFVPIQHDKSELIIYTACLWILNGIVLAGVGLSLLSSYIGTPAEIALQSENDALVQQLHETRNSIENLESRISDIAQIDNDMYRTVLGMNPLTEKDRQENIGGRDPYSDFDVYSEDASEILRWTASRLNNLERRVNIQKISFEEIKEYYNDNHDRLSHIPAIKPVNGVILSGYGMRIHPVLGYQRMHEGLDFRVDIGTPVYASGDATVKSTSRRGTYGLMVILDHGFGYETRFAHLSGFAQGIKPGTKLKRGDLVGFTGRSGMVQGPHLHYEVRVDGNPVDPIHYLFADTTPDEYMMYQEIASSNPQSMD